jgi:ATPase subunit of ABC transporter with duplicated ATPase domains
MKEPYERYAENRRSQLDRQEALWKADQREKRIQAEKLQRIENAVEHAQASISRQDPHGGRLLKKKMKAVKSLEHRFEREDNQMTERPYSEWAIDASWAEGISFPSGKTVLTLDLPELRAGEQVLSRNLHLSIVGPEKVLIIGENGSGKTTLLRHIVASLSDRNDLKCAYMPQDYTDSLPYDLTPVEYLHTDGSKEQLTGIRIHLGAFRFTREEMEHPIRSLSGGQKAKLFLIHLILQKANVLILDEPTRNLSPLSAPAVRTLLREFRGAILFVTHDRKLIQETATRVLRLTEDGLAPFDASDL